MFFVFFYIVDEFRIVSLIRNNLLVDWLAREPKLQGIKFYEL